MEIEEKTVGSLTLGTRVSIRFSFLQRIPIFVIPKVSSEEGFVDLDLYISDSDVSSFKTITMNKNDSVWKIT